MKLSAFGCKFTADAGITSLMDDLGNAMASGDDMIMMGGGNPGHIPEIQQRVQEILADMSRNEGDVRRLVGIYDPPQGFLPNGYRNGCARVGYLKPSR